MENRIYPYIKESKDFKVVVLDHNNIYIYYSPTLSLLPEEAFSKLLSQEEFNDEIIQNLKNERAVTDYGVYCGIAYVHRKEKTFF